jgi:hypothetical protein
MSKIELTDEQKKLILDNFDKMNLLNLTRFIFKDQNLDGRSLQGKEVKEFLSEQNKTVKTTKYEKMPLPELTEENKRFIEHAVAAQNSKPIEMARIIYNNPKMAANTLEFRAVYEYVRSIDPNQANLADEPVDSREYKPPQNIQGIAGRVNQYVTTGSSKGIYNPNDLKPSEEKRCKILMSYMKSPRFVYQASSYERKIDRTLFESEFVRFTYDKEDLTPEEVTQYVSLCSEIVNEAQANRILSHFQNEVEAGFCSDDDAKKKYSVSLSENLNAWRNKCEASKKQQNALLDKLTESRSTRLAGKLNQNASVLNLIDLWIQQESRDKMLFLANKEKEEDRDEVNRLDDYEAVISLIAGQTKEEAGN